MSDDDLATEQGLDEEQQEADVEKKEELSEQEQQVAKLKEVISVETEEIGPLRVKLTVTVPRDALDERRGEQLAELKRDAVIPGFRKGHAPLELVEKRFGSDVGDQLITQLIGMGYLAATEKEDLKPLGDPLFWAPVKENRTDEHHRTQTIEAEKLLPLDRALEHMTVPQEGPLTFSCELELKPEFELPKLEKIPVRRPAITIDDNDVDAELKRLRMSRGTFRSVEDGAIEADDLLYASMEMSVEGKVIETEENIDLAARDLRVKGVPLIGFGDAVIGRKIDEPVTFEATVPDDHDNIDIRGKTAQFLLTIREMKRLEVPPIDEAFLAAAGFETEEELRKAFRSALESRVESMVQRSMREQIGDYLIDHTDLEVPEGLSQRQTDRSIQRRRIEMYRANVPETQIAKAVDEMRTRAHDQVVRDLKLFFILEKIADERSIDVGEEQINGAIAEIARQSNKRFDRVRDELRKGDGLTTLYLQLRDQQVLEDLLKDADITEASSKGKDV